MDRKLTLLTLREASELLGRSEKAIRGLIYRGVLPAYKLGGRLYLKPEDIQRALKPVGRP